MLYIFTEQPKGKLDFLNEIENVKVSYLFNGKEWYPKTFEENDLVVYMPLPVIKEPKVPENQMIGTFSGALKCKNKLLGRTILQEAKLPVPKTWFKLDAARIPFIARPASHSYGDDFYIIRKESELKKLKNMLKRKSNWYFSELIEVEREYRVMVLNNEIFLIYNRQIFGEVENTIQKRIELRQNHAFERYECADELTEDQRFVSAEACRFLGLGYGAVDLIIDKNNNAYIVEINTSPSLEGEIVREKLSEAIKKLAAKTVK